MNYSPKLKLIRITTVPISLDKLLSGQLQFMSSFYDVTAISSDLTFLNEFAKKEKVKVFPIEMTRKITHLQDLKALWQLYIYFKKEKPFIVHTHTPKAGTLGILAAKLAGVPHRLHTIAGLPLLEATGFKRTVLNAVEKATYACATKIFPNSIGLQEIIIKEKLCNPNKLKVLGNGSSNGINTNYFNPRNFSAKQNQDLKKSLGIDPNDFIFIFVGRLVGDKGINELIMAFKKVASLNHYVKLILVGPFESDLDPLAEDTLREIKHNVQISSVGFQKDVRPFLAIAHALVFPSYREGFPNVVMQAGAMGLPSIVTNINGCNEIISEGKNGIIIPVKDTRAIQQAMMKMMNEKELYKQLQSNARKMITDRYEQQVIWEAILNEYDSLERTVQSSLKE